MTMTCVPSNMVNQILIWKERVWVSGEEREESRVSRCLSEGSFSMEESLSLSFSRKLSTNK